MLKDFKEFAIKGNVIDMAVGIIIGGAFSTIVKSLVDDVLTPPLGLLIGSVDFSNMYLELKPGTQAAATLADAKAAGAVTLNYGLFLNATISFLIMAFAVFLLVRVINKLRHLHDAPEAPAAASSERDCPYCLSPIPIAAKRCRACTADVATVVG